MNEVLTVERAYELLRELDTRVESFREHWYPHWNCDCDSTQNCGICHCGHPGHPILPGRPLPFEGTFCPRCVVDLVVLAEELGKDVDLETCKKATARQREQEKRAAGGKDPYFLEGKALRAAVLELCLKTLEEREVELEEAKRSWDPYCHCGEGARFCGECDCGAPGHTQHFPGAVPFTGGWCDDCAVEIKLLAEVIGTMYGIEVIEEAAIIRRKRSSAQPFEEQL